MSTQITLEDLQTAIEQLRPELPTLLGMDYQAFVAELDSYLHMRSVNRLLDLFGRYPAAHNRLLDTIAQREEETVQEREESLVGFDRLAGDEHIPWPLLYYRCENGPHAITVREVEQRDAAGRPLCPQHHIAMNVISPEDVKTAIEQWRSELPGLLGEKYQAFIAKLDSAMQGESDDSLLKLFEAYPAASQRLLEILV